MNLDVIIERKSDIIKACIEPTIEVTVYQQYGKDWADSTRLGVGRIKTFRLPKEEADKLELDKEYTIIIIFEEKK